MISKSTISLALGLGLFVSNSSLADDGMTPAEFCSRLSILGEVYVTNAEGDVLLSKDNEAKLVSTARILDHEKKANTGSVCRMDNSWSPGSNNGTVYIRSEWTVDQQGHLRGKITEFNGFKEDAKRGGHFHFTSPLKEQEFLIKDMTPIIWPSVRNKDQRLVVRFTPTIGDTDSPTDISKLPISGVDMVIVDNSGKLWANHLGAEGIYVGFNSLEGSLFLSYYPFKGAKVLGSAKDNTMELILADKRTVTIYSKTAFVPSGMRAKVYGIFKPELKSPRLSSQSISASNQEEQFLKSIERRQSGNR